MSSFEVVGVPFKAKTCWTRMIISRRTRCIKLRVSVRLEGTPREKVALEVGEHPLQTR